HASVGRSCLSRAAQPELSADDHVRVLTHAARAALYCTLRTRAFRPHDGAHAGSSADNSSSPICCQRSANTPTDDQHQTLKGARPSQVSVCVFFFSSSVGDGRQSLSALRLIDRKSTRLNSSHVKISYAVFCLKKKTQILSNI